MKRELLPPGKTFAFSILDDTDDATVQNVAPLYELLAELGFRTTKTAWPLDCPEGSPEYFAAQTLQDHDYLEFVRSLVERGFELAAHGATMESSRRERTVRGLAFFREQFGAVPMIYCNHGQNRENIYWGPRRYGNRLLRALASFTAPKVSRGFQGECETSPYFWGDLCRDEFTYVRNFTFPELNVLEFDPDIPYRLRDTPYVNYWFSTTDAPDVDAFVRVVTRDGIDDLRAKNGVCIVSTHLGKGFVRNGRVDEGVEDVLRYIAQLPGWFVPAGEILEMLRVHRRSNGVLPRGRRLKLELRHAISRYRARFFQV